MCALVIAPRYLKDTLKSILYPLSPCTNLFNYGRFCSTGRREDRDKNGVRWQGPELFFSSVVFFLPGNGICPSTHDLLQWLSV